jgi:hypothetical protein
VLFPSAGGSNNDPGAIEHVENGNVGELWLSSSDDWRGVSADDRIVFGDRSRGVAQHEFDSAGNVEHRGDVTVGGAISSTCPTGMSFAAGWCIDDVLGNNGALENFGAAVRFCNRRGKMVCPYDALMMCDELDTPSACSTKTSEVNTILWTSTRHGDRGDLGENWRGNLMCFRNGAGTECSNTQTHDYFCCSHAYPGTP